jgi:WD40 repeat protein
LKVWDADDGRLIKQGLDRGRLVSTETWEPGPKVGLGVVFAPDGKMFARAPTAGSIELLDLMTNRRVAMLEDPNLDLYYQLLFTPDGTKLIALTRNHKGIRVWDLRLIRRELKEIGLDWDWPEFPDAAASEKDD